MNMISNIMPHRSARRRGSALMVALALLMMLAVFAALFLTSSRFDHDASTATIDYVRMDLYAEGVAQYVQSCMVAGLWGFDDKPLNNDGVNPYPSPVGTPPTATPGPDSPFDYFGGEVLVDPDGNTAGGASANGDETFFYPNFWLTDPNLRPNAGGNQVFRHAAFSPAPAAEVPFYAVYDISRQWQYADLDGDGQADTPWQFVKPLGRDLYLRAAVWVEDTSSRVNVNVANQPIPAAADLAAIYRGYPAGITIPAFGNEIVGGFLSEFNAVGMAGAVVVDPLNDGDGAKLPGRFGLADSSLGPTKTWPHAGDVPSIAPPIVISAPVPPMQRLLLGDPSLLGDPATGLWGGGRLSAILDGRLGYAWLTNPGTYDPDGLVRRLDAPVAFGGVSAPEQDRPFVAEETFDLMSLLGYTRAAGIPAKTRLESLWPDVWNGAPGAPWRRLLTTYSWTANLCPYGEDPYADGRNTYRKVNLNTCTAAELRNAINAANTHALYGSLTDEQIDQMAVNFIGYRNRPMTAADLGIYLMAVHDSGSDTTVTPPPAWLEWDATAWNTYVTTTQTFSANNEVAYLLALNAQRGTAAFWTEISNAVSATPRISPTRVPTMTRTVGATTVTVYGLTLSPFVTEVWRSIQYPVDVAAAQDPGDATKTNDYAIELYNPWTDTLLLDGWYVYIRGHAAVGGGTGDSVISLAGQSIAPMSRLVVQRLVAGPGILQDANLVLATQAGGSLDVQLVYSSAGAPPGAADYAVFDMVPSAELASFQGGTPPAPNSGSRYRRDDSGFWCYQRWYDDLAGTLGIANLPPPAIDEPWDSAVTIYGPNPAVPTVGVGQVLSPAEVALVPYAVPQQVHGGVAIGNSLADATISADLTTAARRFETLRLAIAPLFHRAYMQPAAGTEAMVSNSVAGVVQSLIDYVTVIDPSQDGVDSNGDGNGSGTTPDFTELRVPGRLNVNTISDDFAKLDAGVGGFSLPLLPLTDPANTRDALFWQNLVAFRDLSGTTFSPGRGMAATGATLYATEPGITQPGISRLGELCNLQAYNAGTGAIDPQGLWQDRDIEGNGSFDLNYLLPAQRIRRLAATANLLSVRSDTFMVTVRVEIVKRIYDSAGTFTRTDRLGQREYMYLIDRSYCTQAPQQAPVVPGDSYFSARVNPNFIPPRVWRMSIPSYAAH